MSVLLTNAPRVRWGPIGEFVWDFPRAVRDFDYHMGAAGPSSVSAMGRVETIQQYSYIDVSFSIHYLTGDDTRNLLDFISWANAGNAFQFTFDYSKELIATIASDASPGDGYLVVDRTLPNVSNEYIAYNHVGQYDKFTAQYDLGILNFITPSLTNSYTANNAIVKHIHHYRAAKTVKRGTDLNLRPGRPIYSWRFAFRETLDTSIIGTF